MIPARRSILPVVVGDAADTSGTPTVPPAGSFSVEYGAAKIPNGSVINIGSVQVENTATLVVYVGNVGTGTLAWDTVTITGTEAAAVTTTAPVFITPGTSKEFVVRVSPTEEGSGQVATVTLSSFSGETFVFELHWTGLGNVINIDPIIKPHAPTSVSIRAGLAFMQVLWTPAAGATSTYIEYGTSQGGPYGATLGPFANTTTDATISGTYDGLTTYYFRLRSSNSAGFGPYTSEYSAVPGVTDTNPGTGGTTLPDASTMQLFAYANYNTPQGLAVTRNVTPMAVAYFGGSSTPESLAEIAAEELSARTSGKRCLYLPSMGRGRIDVSDAFGHLTPAQLVVNGFTTSAWATLLERFWSAFDDAGGVCDCVMLDEETLVDGVPIIPRWYYTGDTYAARHAAMAEVCALTSAQRMVLPYSIRNLTAAAWDVDEPTDAGARYVGIWDSWVEKKRAQALRAIVVDSYQRTIGVPPVVVNYGDTRTTVAFRDWNTWPYPAAEHAIGSWSSPVTYPRYDTPLLFASLTKAPAWNAWILAQNTLRASRWPELPWIGVPGWDGTGTALYEAATYTKPYYYYLYTIRHAAALGISRAALFCPYMTEDMHRYVQEIVETTLVRTHPRRRLPQIAYDADSVTTNGTTTAYVEAEWT